MLPTTSRRAVGEAVPIPTLPEESIRILSVLFVYNPSCPLFEPLPGLKIPVSPSAPKVYQRVELSELSGAPWSARNPVDVVTPATSSF